MIPILPRRELKLLGAQYREAEEMLKLPDSDFYRVNEAISLWSPAQELSHIGYTNSMIFSRIETLYNDEAEEIVRKGGPNALGWKVLTLGKIPRGKGRASGPLEPDSGVLRSEVIEALGKSKREMTGLADRAPYLHATRGRWKHGLFGELNALQWLKLSRIHMAFHLKITRQILASGKGS